MLLIKELSKTLSPNCVLNRFARAENEPSEVAESSILCFQPIFVLSERATSNADTGNRKP